MQIKNFKKLLMKEKVNLFTPNFSRYSPHIFQDSVMKKENFSFVLRKKSYSISNTNSNNVSQSINRVASNNNINKNNIEITKKNEIPTPYVVNLKNLETDNEYKKFLIEMKTYKKKKEDIKLDLRKQQETNDQLFTNYGRLLRLKKTKGEYV